MSETTPEAPPHPGPSRRTVLKGAAVGAGALWVTPTVLSLGATPAAASPAGCNICLPPANQLIPLAVGNGTSLVGWTNQANIEAVGGVFRTSNFFTQGSARFVPPDFTTECIARFASQTPVDLTLAANLTAPGSPSSVTVTFYSTPGGVGTPVGSPITIASNTVQSASGPIPPGAVSLRVTMTTGFWLFARGTVDNITLTVGTC
ncbi:MAG: hypothetical protein MUE36_01315 [Acidimicrobiales bacterium]|jgi:hypothetical protein|nr:hypothetical protein [Acidimicrobiales bacterium]